MTQIVMHGSWRIVVVRKDSDWPQRVVVTGSASGVVPGVLGASGTVSGDRWCLTVEHDPGGGWRPSAYVHAGPTKEDDGRGVRTVVSKDHFWPGDREPDDLVLRLEHLGGVFEIAGTPQLVADVHRDAGSAAEARYLAVTVRNTGHKTFGYDTTLEITDTGRTALARRGIAVEEDWRPETLRATGQEASGRAVLLPPLEPGAHCRAYFPVSVQPTTSGDAAEVEFEVVNGEADHRISRTRRSVHMPAPALAPADDLMISGDAVAAHARTRLPETRPATPVERGSSTGIA
jgi:hypothetical protein